jgi:hypothetical protein
MTQADLKAAHADPTVKTVLEVFGGHIADVQRLHDSDSENS